MSVTIRGTKFHYRFRLHGRDYSGPCPGIIIPENAGVREISALRKRAASFEAEIRLQAEKDVADRAHLEEDVRKNRTVRALVENYRYELTGGRPVHLEEAYDLAANKPSRRPAVSRFAEQRKTYFSDFVAFIKNSFPDVSTISDLRRTHCESYVTYLVEHGRFIKSVSYNVQLKQGTRSVSYRRAYGVSPKTIREIVGVCKWVFRCVAEDAGLIANPWDGVQLPEPNPIPRDIFTPTELRLIWEGIQHDPFCYPLFVVAANSGMTEGDICTLKWSEVEWGTGYIRRKRRKTGAPISLPLIPELAEYLQSIPHTGEYVFPEHAEIYLRSPSTVSERVKAFLHGIGLVTTVDVPGRRAVSVKDLHSMRHVFCYRAKRAGIPESVIAKFVGHKLIAMTQHYADHDTDEELRTEIKKLQPLFVGAGAGTTNTESTARRQLAELSMTLPLEKVVQLLNQARALTLPDASSQAV